MYKQQEKYLKCQIMLSSARMQIFNLFQIFILRGGLWTKSIIMLNYFAKVIERSKPVTNTDSHF
jgi:hypothetical protein